MWKCVDEEVLGYARLRTALWSYRPSAWSQYNSQSGALTTERDMKRYGSNVMLTN